MSVFETAHHNEWRGRMLFARHKKYSQNSLLYSRNMKHGNNLLKTEIFNVIVFCGNFGTLGFLVL